MNDNSDITDNAFPVDGKLLMILPRAAASLRNPDFQQPTLYYDGGRYYLAMTLEPDPDEESEVAITRRMRLDEFSEAEWEELQEHYKKLDLRLCRQKGINKVLEAIPDRRVQRLFAALLTFLNARQIAILLYLYQEAAKQKNGALVTFRSNELLESLGYKRTIDRRLSGEDNESSFPAGVRSQLHKDLVAMHSSELTFAKSLRQGNKRGAEVEVKNVLHIEKYKIDNLPREFDLLQAANYSFGLADEYTIRLGFLKDLVVLEIMFYFPIALTLLKSMALIQIATIELS